MKPERSQRLFIVRIRTTFVALWGVIGKFLTVGGELINHDLVTLTSLRFLFVFHKKFFFPPDGFEDLSQRQAFVFFQLRLEIFGEGRQMLAEAGFL